MDSHVILDAIGMVDDQFILSAEKRFGQQSAGVLCKSSGRHSRSRAFISVAAAVLLLIGSFITAMAVHEDFRERVFAFFHIATAENVPDGSNVDVPGTTADLGYGVSAEYIHVGTELTLVGNGTMYEVEHDENGNMRGASFYQLSEGALHQIPTSSTQFEIVVSGIPVSGSVYWCVANGSLTAIGNGHADDLSKTWSITTIGQQSEVVLLSVFGGIVDKLEFHAFLLNLHTGNAEPVFSGTGLCSLSHVQDIQVTSDYGHALVWGRPEHERKSSPYLCDLRSGQLVSLQKVVGEETIGNAFWVDDDTLLLSSKENDRYSCWVYSVPEATLIKTIDSMPLNAGDTEQERIVEFGCRYVLCVYQDNTVAVIDQKNGAYSSVMEGFAYDDRAEIVVSADGRKVCYYVSARPDDSLNVATLGVIDFQSARFTVFERSGFEQNREWRLGWIDSNRIGISVDGSRSDLYVYQFE